MQLFEMQGLLAGKCLPGDIKVNESLAEYLLRQLNQRDELARQVSALQTSQDNIINGLVIKGDGPVSKLVIEYAMSLGSLAEERREFIINGVEMGYIELPGIDEDPATQVYERCLLRNTFAAQGMKFELKAQGVDEAAESAPWLYGSQMGVQVEAVPREELIKFAANLRKEVKDKELMDVIDSMGGSGNKAARRAANLRAGRKG